jgi:hypothetical protein
LAWLPPLARRLSCCSPPALRPRRLLPCHCFAAAGSGSDELLLLPRPLLLRCACLPTLQPR